MGINTGGWNDLMIDSEGSLPLRRLHVLKITMLLLNYKINGFVVLY